MIRTPSRSKVSQAGATTSVYCLVYLLLCLFLDRSGFSNGWTLLWPLNGLTIALLIMSPRSKWPAMLLGIGIGIGVGEYIDESGLTLVLWQRSFSIVEVVISALLLPPFTGLEAWLQKPRIYLRFMASLFLGPLISGVMAATYYHATTRQGFLSGLDDWAGADALGIAAVMPLVLSFRSPEMRDLFRRPAAARTCRILCTAFVTATVVFSVSSYPLLFLLYPALVMVDALLAFAGSSIAVFGTSLIAVYLTSKGVGPFGRWPGNLAIDSEAAFQIYLGFQLIALFPASLMILERRRMGMELRESNAKLLLLASVDGLTGVANRRALDSQFAQEWNRAIRMQTPLAFLMIDVDHFKQFNDLYGHHAGDECLREVATALAREMRRNQDYLARFGGEEFAILLPHTDTPGAFQVAERLRAAVINLAIPHQASSAGMLSISLGCASVTPSLGSERTRLLEMADQALYTAKRSGRNRTAA